MSERSPLTYPNTQVQGAGRVVTAKPARRFKTQVREAKAGGKRAATKIRWTGCAGGTEWAWQHGVGHVITAKPA